MPSIKTAISLHESLFEQVEALAHEMHISRSRLFALAVEEFLQHRQNLQLLEKVNAAYGDGPTPSEQTLQRHMRHEHRRIVESQW